MLGPSLRMSKKMRIPPPPPWGLTPVCSASRPALVQKKIEKHLFLSKCPSASLFIYSKTCVKRSLSKRPKLGFQD